MSKINDSDRAKLYGLQKHEGWEVFERIFKDNLIASVHLGMETEDEPKDFYRDQGYVFAIRDIFGGMKKETTNLEKKEENEKLEEKVIDG